MIERAIQPYTQALVAFLAATLLPLTAIGQGAVGSSIVGYVSDTAGAPIPGVRIVASSATQIGGDRVATSNERGAFRLSQLMAGTFRVTASAPGRRTVVHERVPVGVSAPAEVNVVLVAASGDEDPQVVDTAPGVVTTTSHVQEAYDLDLVEAMPLPSRYRVLEQMVDQVAGALGNRLRGGANNQTIVMQDGFDTGIRYPVSTAAAGYEVQSAGYGADNAAASGGLVNVVTRAGSNRWEVDVDATAENETLRLGDEGASSGSYYYRVNPFLAGPLLRDKLWFALAVESHLLGQGRVTDRERILDGAPPYRKLANLGTLKVTWQIDLRNRLTFLGNFEGGSGSNLKRDVGVAEEAQQNWREGPSGLWGVIWEAQLTDRLSFRSQTGYSQRPQYWYPRLCEDAGLGTCDGTPAVINRFPRRTEDNNAAFGCPGERECFEGRTSPHRREDLHALQVFNRVDYFLDHPIVGEHQLHLKHQAYREKEIRRQAQPGGYFDELNGNVPEARTTFYANDLRFEPGRPGWWSATHVFYRSSASLADTWRPTRYLRFTAAISHIWSRGQDGAAETVIEHTAWAPSVAGVWDATHDGRTALRGSYSQYLDVDLRGPVLHSTPSQVSQRCLWNQTTQAYERDCEIYGGVSRNTFGSPCGPTGLDAAGRSCLRHLTAPRTREYTIGAEREVFPGVGLSLDLVYRTFANQYELQETNRIWNASGTAVTGYRSGRAETVLDLDTPDSVQRTYRGASMTLEKRRGALRSMFSYTLSDLRETVFTPASNRFGNIGGEYVEGPEPDDRRHALKAAAAWAASRWLSFGFRYQYGSGLPVNRSYRNPVTGSYENYRAVRGVNPGTTFTASGEELRTPHIQSLDLQIRFVLAAARHRLDLYADALGVLNAGRATDDGPSFAGDTAARPLRLRVGVSYRF